MAAPNALHNTVKLYQNVIEEVVNNVRESFLDEAVDEAILMELKQMWENKVLATKVIDTVDSNHSNGARNGALSMDLTHLAPSTSQPHNDIINVASMRVDYSKNTTARAMHNRGFEYNPGVAPSRPMPLLQQSVPVSNYITAAANGMMSSNRIEALVRGLPHSLITNVQHNMYMQMAGVQGTLHNILPQSTLMSAGGHSQQFSGLLLRPDKVHGNSSLAHHPNVIVSNNQTFHQADYPSSSSAVIQSDITNRTVASKGQPRSKVVIQLDGPGVASEDDEDDDDLVEDEEDEINVEDDGDEVATGTLPLDEGDALNSEDDEVSEGNGDEMFEADDVVVCQFEKISRIRNKWKFILKDGIIHLGRKDYVFNKAIGEAEF